MKARGWTATAATAACVASVASVACAAGAQPLCRVLAVAQPSEAVVGQQIEYRIRILRREAVEHVDWVTAPRFEGFRAERLPGRPEEALTAQEPARVLAREERRALYPLLPGVREIRGASLRCTARAEPGESEARSVQVDVPPVQLRAAAPPERERPAHFAGLIERVSVRVSADRSKIRLGESVRLTVSVLGPGNLWDLNSPLRSDRLPDDVELFPLEPELVVVAGERLQVHRTFRADLVPHRAGSLVVPALRVSYYDPARRRYGVASSDALVVQVAPRPLPDSKRRRKR